MPRGRPSRNSRVRNTCVQCRVFIPSSSTLCSNCAETQTGNNGPSSTPQTASVTQSPSQLPTIVCRICKTKEVSDDSLCSNCCPLSLNIITSAECCKCRRIPPAELNRVQISELKRTAFGCTINGNANDVVNLCDECTRYCLNGYISPWSCVWPSVILDFLCGKFYGSICGKPFHKVLPTTVMEQYQHLFANNVNNGETLFDDLTPKVKEYNELKKDLKIENVMKAHNKYCFPEIRCPFGCSEFVGESGVLPFQYFLLQLDPEFKLRKANWKNCLRCVRPDWLDEYKHNDKFKIKAHLIIDEKKGLCIATCKFHNGGSNKHFIHPPTNPTGRLPSKAPDRLGPATISYNCYKPAKTNFSSHTYSMGVAKGSFAGISSTTIGCKRKWDIAFGKDDLVRESLCCNKRRDVKPLLQNLVKNGEISQNLFDSITSTSSLPEQNVIDDCLLTTTSVTFESSMAIKDLQEKGVEVKYFPLFSHPFDSYGSCPSDLTISSPDLPHLWCFTVMFSLSCNFHSSLCRSISPLHDSLKTLFPLMIRNKGKSVDAAARRELVACMENLCPDPATDFTSDLNQFLGTIEFIRSYETNDRNNVDTHMSRIDNCDIVTFTNRCRTDANVSLLPDRVNTQSGASTYELRSMTLSEGSSIKTVVRHGLQFDCWWLYSNDSTMPSKVKSSDNRLMSQFHSNWTCCHYEKITSPEQLERKYQYLEYLGGQGRFLCETHQVPLTVTDGKQSFECSYEPICNRKAAWSCPSDGCSSAVCRAHFKENVLSNDRIKLRPRIDVATSHSPQQQLFNEQEDPVFSEPESDCDEFSFVNYATDSGALNNANDLSATNSGDVASVVDSSNNSLPMHLLLNSDCHVLQRKALRNERNKNSSRFLQNIVASTSGNSVPLLYPDAALFPSHYYHEQEDGTMTGSIPAPLYNEKQSLTLNFADVKDQKRTALLNPTLLQSTDIRSIQTSFDTVFNRNLSFTDTRIVLNRGFQEVSNKQRKTIGSDQHSLQFDKSDSRVRVNELAALLSKDPATFFLTLTCNQKDHFGVAPIFEALENKFDRNNKEEWDRAVQAEIVLLTRAWYRSATALMEYLERSPDKPLGTVTKIWYRFEFQSTKGNLPHIHAVIWTKESKEELKFKVSCSGASALFELRKISSETKLLEKNDVLDCWEHLMTVQTHSCEKASFRCHKVTRDDGTTVCRVPRYPQSHTYSWRKVPTCHCDETLEKLHKIDLAVPSKTFDNSFDVSPSLQGGKFEYPAASDEHLSPFNVLLFVITQSSQNLQICDEYLSARYIAKYAAGIEERADARVDPISFKDIKVNSKGITNVKISGTKIKSKSTDKKTIVQIIPLVETIWWLLGFNYVYTSVTFVHLSTHEKTERAAIVKRNAKRQSNSELPSHVTKISTLSSARQFTQSQLLLLRDYLSSELLNCKMSVFSGRPPALLFVDNPQTYFTWFKRSSIKNPENKIKTDTSASAWIDVFGQAVHLRRCYLNDFEKYWEQATSEGHKNLHRFNEDTSILFLKNDAIGLKTTDDRLVQVVTSNIVPSNPYKFLVHFALSYGRFETEIDLFNQTNMIEVYKHCQLLPAVASFTEEHAFTLIRRYVLTELKFLPGASRSFDRHFLSSYDVFKTLLMTSGIHFEALPPLLHSEIAENAEIEYHNFNYQKRIRSVQGCLLNSAMAPLRCYEDKIVDATRQNPFNYNMTFPRATGQSDESFSFQTHVFDDCQKKLRSYIHGNEGFVKHQMCLGRPGSGKTLICTMLFLKAVAKGLNCSITCLSGERAQQLGGEHVHKMFKFRVNKLQVPESMASQSIKSLLKDVTRFTDLERLDVLFIDEIGQLNSELLTAMELVLQHVRDNRLPMGGVFTIMSGDPKQLKPPDGSLVWLSPKLLTNYDFYYFVHYVRAVPGLLREILCKLDENNISSVDAANIAKEIVSNSVVKNSWSEVNDTFAMRVFSTRAAEQEAVKQHTVTIQSDQVRSSIILQATDEQSSTGSSIWLPATASNSTFINSHSITPKQIILYHGALLRFTANIPSIEARQGQLCLLLQLPTQSSNSLEVLIAPPGCRSAPCLDEATLIASGWRKASVANVYSPVITNEGIFLRRFFFPVKNYVASTIHKCLGDTFPKIVTKVSSTDKNYKIWEKEQLLVLLSRVSRLDDLTFVGTAEDLERTLIEVIQRQSCWCDFISNFLSQMTQPASTNQPTTMNLLTSNFMPWNVVLPSDDTGFVYILLSTKLANVFYIGETINLRQSLREHNSGHGDESTRPIERRPWAMLAFITG